MELAARRARLATIVVFAAHSLVFASWTAHIPHVKAELGLGDAALGLAILGAPVGAVIAIVATGRLLASFGSRAIIRATLVGYCASGVTVGLADSQFGLFLALALWGAFQGSLDVAMNTQGVSVERALGRPVMAGFHAAWSIGGFAGAALGAAVVGLGGSLTGQLIVLGALAAFAAGWATRSLLPDPPREPVDAKPAHRVAGQPAGSPRTPARGVLRARAVLLLGGVALACMFCEGAAADWSAVYLHDSLGTTPAVAGLGYAVFSAAMVAFRLGGDRLLHRIDPRDALPLLAVVSTIGFGLALAVGEPTVALAGWLTLGVGLALVIPAAVSAAGQLPGVTPGAAVAAVSGLGWAGYVGGPPLIGVLSELTSLPMTLALVPVATLGIAATARWSQAFAPPPRAPCQA